MSRFSMKGNQYEQPLLEFSGACAGCGKTPYMKLLTQLFGERMVVANATGCTQAWGFSVPSYPYTTRPNGRGLALSNSLFENNAEYSLGMVLSVRQQRLHLKSDVQALLEEARNQCRNRWARYTHLAAQDYSRLLDVLEDYPIVEPAKSAE